MGTSLYAYELPPAQEIKPMTVQEERGIKHTCGLNQIQRMHSSKINSSNTVQMYYVLCISAVFVDVHVHVLVCVWC